MDDDTLVSRRSKRSTAGNRMEVALAEFKAEELGMDIEEDVDFALDNDEEDLFESDFESTDEEGAQEDVDATAEKLIRQEESQVRKAGRTQLERITALAHARQAATFNPTSIGPPPEKSKGDKHPKRRVSLGLAVNVETGEVLDAGEEALEDDSISATVGAGKRHSTRTHTVLNTTASVSRSRDEVRKQASVPKRVKMNVKALTQAELVARALDMEEGNIAEHRNYLTLEEEKRRKARVVRTSVQGPLVRWVSKKEEETILEFPPAPLPRPVSKVQHSNASSSGSSGYPSVSSHQVPYSLYSLPPPIPPTYSPFQQWPPPPPPPAYLQTPLRQSLATTSYPTVPPLSIPAPVPKLLSSPSPIPPPQPIEKKVIVGKQYVVHELGQTEKTSRPKWSGTMAALFGDHAEWESLRVYTAKGRPTARPMQTCAVTGKVARYLDPRTNVPYADLGAYRVLSQVLRHEHIWSPTLQCYVSKEGSVFMQDGA